MTLSIHAVVLLSVVILAAVIDINNKIIPNWLTYPALVLGLLFSILPDSELTLVDSLLGFSAAFFPALLLFIFNSLGGGDVKLLSVVGVWVGFPIIFDVMFYSIAAGAGIGLVLIIWKGQFWLFVSEAFLKLLTRNNYTDFSANEMRIPFGAAIALGTIWALFLPRFY